MVVQVTPSGDDSQRVIVPLCPLSVIVPLLLPEHTVAEPAVVPPKESALSVMITLLVVGAHGAAGVIVQVKVYVVPGTRPLAVAFGSVLSSKVTPAAGLTVHNPVPTVGVFPASW